MAIEIIYLRTLLANMQLRQSDYTPVFEDNTACIEWGNHVIGGRESAKHIDIRKHFAHKAVQNGHTRVYKIATEFQLADIITKALQLHQFEPSRTLEGCGRLRDVDPQEGGETNL